MPHTRRQLLAGTAATLALPVFSNWLSAAPNDQQRVIATNTYPWLTFDRRDGREFKAHSDALLTDIADTGITGYEPIIGNKSELVGLGDRLSEHGLSMRSIYVNSELHDAAKIDGSTAAVIEIATEAKKLGTEIVVTNPSPIRWGGPENKSDAQLRLQAKALDALGAELRKLGMALAYHNHDAELREGAREFHHMLTATDPDNVRFCLDSHWIYRGCGNSELAVFDAITHYHQRIVELHLRQSAEGIWTETFAPEGDINYERIFEFLDKRNIRPHLVLEQAVEAQSPKKLSAVDAHRASHANLRSALS